MKDEVVLQTGKEKRRFQADSKQIIKVPWTKSYRENSDNGNSQRTVNVYHRRDSTSNRQQHDNKYGRPAHWLTDWLILLENYERQLRVIKKVIDFFSLLVDKKNVCVCVFVWEYWLVFLAPTSAIAASDNTHILGICPPHPFSSLWMNFSSLFLFSLWQPSAYRRLACLGALNKNILFG